MGIPLLLFSKQQKKKPLTYIDRILSLGPIAYWPLNETSGTTAVNLVSTGLNGSYTACTLGQAQAPFVAPAFDGSTSYCNIYSAALNTAKAFLSEGSFSIWAKVSGAGVWTDGVPRRIVAVLTATDNFTIRRGATNGTLVMSHVLGGTAKSVAPASLSYSGWFHLVMTWTDSGDAFIAYLQGAQTGTTQTSLGTQSANDLLNANCCIGSENVTPGNVWSGWLAHCAIWNRPLTPTEVANLYAWGL